MRARLAVLAMMLDPPALATEVPHYAQFQSWVVACDNVRRCEARGFDAEAGSADLQVLRDAGDAPAEFRLVPRGAVDIDMARLDGAPLRIGPPAWATGLELRDPAAVADFVRQVRNGRRITFGKDSTGIPLDGFAASLLRMDDVQGRAGTPGSLLAPRGAGRVPPAPALPDRPRWRPVPALSSVQKAAFIAATRRARAATLAKESCDQQSGPKLVPIPPDDADALDNRRVLVILGCSSGAYQGFSLVFVVPRSGGPAVRFSTVLPTWKEPFDGLTEATFDPRTGTLGTFGKGRGIADCGMSAEWVWSAGAFRVASVTRLTTCGSSGGAGDWPYLVRMASARP